MIALTFVIPAYQEEKRIKKTLSALTNWVSPSQISLQKVIFVNDGSTDKTITRIRTQKKKLEKILGAEIEIISYAPNRGKGFAIQQGMHASSSDYTLFFDVDMSTPLTEIKKFLPHMKNGIDIIVGTRKNGKATVIAYQPKYRQLLGKAYTKLSNTILSLSATDHTCGFKAVSRNAKNTIFQKTRITGWAYDSEILYLARKYTFSTHEVPVVWANDGHSRVQLFQDIISSLLELMSIRVSDLLGVYDKQPVTLFSPTLPREVES